MNYVLQIDLGDGFGKAETALDSLLKKVGKLSSGSVDFSMDKMIDESGILKSGEGVGEVLGDGIKKGVKKNLIGNWLGLTGEFGQAVQKGAKDFSKFWDDAIKNGGAGAKSTLPSFKGLREIGGADLAKVQGLGDITQFDKIKEKLDFKKILTGLALGLSGDTFTGSRLLSDQLSKSGLGGKGGGVANGIFGAGGIAGFAEIRLGFKAFKLAVDLFKSTIEIARQMYSKALQSGMGLNFSIRRGALADILGVSENDVFKFGAQVAYLNKQLDFSVSTLAKTNKSLTEMSWGLKISEYDLKALAAQLFDAMSPAIGMIIDDFNSFIETLGKSEILKNIGEEINVVMVALGDVVGLFEIGINTIVDGIIMITDQWTICVMTVLNWLSRLPGLGVLGGWDTSKATADRDKHFNDLAAEIAKFWSNFGGKSSSGMPSPQAWMKQLPASSLEKMGLVTMGGTQNYTKDIAKNTKEMATALKTLISKSSGKPQNSAFNMSPTTAQP